MTRIALVGCAKEKRSAPVPARVLYRSSLFGLAVQFAEATCDRFFILSALHALVEPERVLAPYDLTLDQVRDRAAWGRDVAEALRRAVPPDATLVLLAGEAYGAFRPFVPNRVETPLAGLGIGQRRAWLARGGRSAA